MEVRAASVNHLDLEVRRGDVPLPRSLPHVLGSDGAGVVVEVPDMVRNLRPGDRVILCPASSCGHCAYCARGDSPLCPAFRQLGLHRNGTYAQLVTVPPWSCFKLPDHISFEEAAAVPTAFLTAWRMLVSEAKIGPGQDVLVMGAASGVGSAALQIARLMGCRAIAAAASEAKLVRAKLLGATNTVEYTEDGLERHLRDLLGKSGADVVVDVIGRDTFHRSLRCVRRGGRLVTCGAVTGSHSGLDISLISHRQIRISGVSMGNQKDFQDVLQCLFSGQLKPVIDRVLPLHEAAEAHRLLETRQVFGKVVLVPLRDDWARNMPPRSESSD